MSTTQCFTVQGLLEGGTSCLVSYSFPPNLVCLKVTQQWIKRGKYTHLFTWESPPKTVEQATWNKLGRSLNHQGVTFKKVIATSTPTITTSITYKLQPPGLSLSENYNRHGLSGALTGSLSLPLLPQPLLQLRWAYWGSTERMLTFPSQRCTHIRSEQRLLSTPAGCSD